MKKVQELQYETECMHDSKDFKDVDYFPTFPVNQRYFFPKMIKEDCSIPPKVNIWDTQCKSGKVFASPPVCPSTSQMQVEFPGGSVRSNLYLEMVMEEKTQDLLREF